ncbi:hypothetical protein Cadr_000010265 [Camelus dromedarius]|uniref:Uncharacterized protein n=1 Tax=Camelus dromedarius TaxID=9838 RepID=A0A5N4DWX6_CAMDR|nr:hypothetical protein Cadr_000010265 [Camelus dromedarius]
MAILNLNRRSGAQDTLNLVRKKEHAHKRTDLLGGTFELKGNLATIMDINFLYRIKQNHKEKIAEVECKSQMPYKPYYMIPLLRKQEEKEIQSLEQSWTSQWYEEA